MRRLPIFFLLDVSESMVGKPLAQLEEGVGRIVASLRKDPTALETVYISVIAFAGKAEVIAPLIDLVSFYPPRLPIGGGTCLGKGLEVLMREIDYRVVRQSEAQRGDWEPLVFLLTDGKPTDVPGAAIARWQAQFARRASIVAVTLGRYADAATLKQLTPRVLAYEGSDDADFRQFVDWISDSVSTRSEQIESSGGVRLAKTPPASLVPVDDDIPKPCDPDFVILTGRCQGKRSPYLVKYARIDGGEALRAFVKLDRFVVEGCYPLDESYFQWSMDGPSERINTEVLEGAPGCPHCGNATTIALCGACNRLLCVDGPGDALCPWCGSPNRFGEGGGNFDLDRSQG